MFSTKLERSNDIWTRDRYLAELACDGKTTYKRDTSEHAASKDASIDRLFSTNSQDTDVVNLNLELISKDEIDSSKSMSAVFSVFTFFDFILIVFLCLADLSTDLIESISFEKDIHHEEKGEESSISRGDTSLSRDCTNKGDTIDERSRGVKDANSDENTFSERDTNVIHHPNVPGNYALSYDLVNRSSCRN